VGMEDYIEARSDVFFTGRDGSLRSNRVLCQLAGQYGVDLFIGSTLQMDADANSSTVTLGRLAGFGGAPNMGHDPRGRRHSSEAWLSLMKNDGPNSAISRGHKLVVQTAETFKKGGEPTIVDALDAIAVGKQSNMPIAPVMIYGDDVSHVVTEEGIAYLHAAEGVEERRAALRAVAGVTPIGMRADPAKTAELRRRGVVAYPEDLGIRRGEAKRSAMYPGANPPASRGPIQRRTVDLVPPSDPGPAYPTGPRTDGTALALAAIGAGRRAAITTTATALAMHPSTKLHSTTVTRLTACPATSSAASQISPIGVNSSVLP